MAASVRDVIDTASGQYGAAFSRIQTGLVRLVERLFEQGRTAEEIVQILASTDFVALVGELGLNKAAADIEGAYRAVLAAKVGRAALEEATLTALKTFTRDSFLGQATALAPRLREEIIKVVLGGGRTSDVAAALKGMIDAHHADTLAATALSTFSRTVELEMAKQDPPDALYVYEGPVDDRTRDICLAMAAAGELTRAEIDAEFPGAFVDGGGFNCRHSWVPADAARELDPESAADRLGDREPVTVREALA